MNLPAEIERVSGLLLNLKAACHEQQMKVNLTEQALARERAAYSDLLTKWQIAEAQLSYLQKLQAEVDTSDNLGHTTPA